MGGMRREKTWAGGILEVAVVHVRARQAEGGAPGPLLQSRLCLTGAGMHRTLGLLRAARTQGEWSPGNTTGPEGSGRAMGH